eukprot:5226662-Heterocapsa_arctica.AAC.1
MRSTRCVDSNDSHSQTCGLAGRHSARQGGQWDSGGARQSAAGSADWRSSDRREYTTVMV